MSYPSNLNTTNSGHLKPAVKSFTPVVSHKFVEQFLITLSTTVKSFTLVVSRKLAQNPTTIQRAGIPTRFDTGDFICGEGTFWCLPPW